MSEQRYSIKGMTCQGCVSRVSVALTPFAGAVSVTLQPPQAILTDPTGDFKDLQAALSSTHYGIEAQIITRDALQDKARGEQTPAFGGDTPTIEVAPRPLDVRPDMQPNVRPYIRSEASPAWLVTYKPLLLILAYIGVSSMLIQIPTGIVSTNETMRYFMAGFFLVFSFFKLLDLQSFANAYADYDLLAQRWRTWGLIYPFVELALGLAYLVQWQPALTNLLTLIVMGFSAIGVLRAVLGQQEIRCACLGTVFQLPMSTVTIIEDLGMAGMAGLMLIH